MEDDMEEMNVDTIPQETAVSEPVSAENATTETTESSTENTTPASAETPVVEKIKVKYDKQEMEIPYDEAVQHIQKGMNYERAVERAKAEAYQQARDTYIAEQGYEWLGKPITTEAEYNQALKEKEIYDNLQNQSLPDEVISEILEGRRDREERQKEKEYAKQQQKQEEDYKQFFKYFADENGRSFDAAQDTIPDEVWQSVNNGKSLIDAYQAHEAKQYKAKIKELESKLNIQQTNQDNAETSTGSVTGQGSSGAEYISYDVFQANRHNQDWVNKNYNKILKSRAKW
jgi:hypothetical protein